MRIISNDHLKISTCFLVMVLQLQIFRRLSLTGYIIVLLSAYSYWFFSIIPNRAIKLKTVGLPFLTFYVTLPIFSLLNLMHEEYVIALMRYGGIMPFIVLSFIYTDVIYKYRYAIMKIFCFVIFMAAVSILYQLWFGKISWFVTNEWGRIGLDRYGSLLGSVTSYGTQSLVAILCIHDYKLFKRWESILMEMIIVLAGFVSLSKAFFINLGIVYMLLLTFRLGLSRKINMYKCLIGAIVTGLILSVMYYAINYTAIEKYFYGMIDYTFSSSNLGITNSFFDRLSRLPRIAFEYYDNPWYYYLLFGVGFKGYGGLLGLNGLKFPQCHNTYMAVVLSQGVFALLSLLMIYIVCYLKRFRCVDGDSLFIRHIIPYILINMFVGQWSYLTTTGSLFLCIIFAIYNSVVPVKIVRRNTDLCK